MIGCHVHGSFLVDGRMSHNRSRFQELGSGRASSVLRRMPEVLPDGGQFGLAAWGFVNRSCLTVWLGDRPTQPTKSLVGSVLRGWY
jgi:hypothetical protein